MYFLLCLFWSYPFCRWDPLWSHPSSTPSPHHSTDPAGFVVREAADGTRIAKARVEQLAAALTDTAPLVADGGLKESCCSC